VDAAGAPVALAAVYVVSAPEPQRDIGQLSGPDGGFVIAATALGTYVIGARADAAGGGQASVTVGDTGRDLHVTIRPDGVVVSTLVWRPVLGPLVFGLGRPEQSRRT
jgi:hypothetical protein